MNCESIRQLLLDLGLDEESRQRVARALAHVQECGACRDAFKDFDQLNRLLKDGGAGNVAPDASSPLDVAGPHDPPDQSDVPPPGGWGAFETRMQAAVKSGRHSSRSSGHTRWTSFNRWRIRPAFGGLAAAVLLGWAGFHLGRQQAVPAGVAIGPAISLHPDAGGKPLAPAEVAEKVRAFGEVNQVFDGRTRWMLLASNTSDVGLAGETPVTQATAATQTTELTPPAARPAALGQKREKLLLVRLHMLRGTEVVSDADLLIVAGTTATVDVPTRHGLPLRYHVTTSADDLMRVAVRVEVPNPANPIAGAGGTGNSAGTPGAPVTVASMDSSAGAATAVLGTCLQLQPYRAEAAGRLVTERGAYELKVSAASSSLPESGRGNSSDRL